MVKSFFLKCFAFLHFSFILFFSSFFLFVHRAGYRMIRKPFFTAAKLFSTIIVNQRMLKRLEKVYIVIAVEQSSLLRATRISFYWNPIEVFGGSDHCAGHPPKSLLCFSRNTFRKSYFRNKNRMPPMMQWASEFLNLNEIRKISYVYVSRNQKNQMTQGKKQKANGCLSIPQFTMCFRLWVYVNIE